ncbi:LysR family transcriptional regulator [Enterobacteriaceae bacterium 89]|nr:LysR family transcriptional regulator [Enterobacteriaceae bacterium 89]
MRPELNLKMLRAIHAVCQTGSVTQAAASLDISPAAVSYLLSKARKATGSALFYRNRHGLAPEPLAKELSERYENVSQELAPEADVSWQSRPLAISAWSLAELLISLAILRDSNNYPECLFHRQVYDDNERLVKLRNKEIDLDIGTRLPVDSAIQQLRFFCGKAGVLVSQNHSTISDSVTLQDWNNNRHAVWQRGMFLINDDFERLHQFDELSHERSIAFTSSTSLNLVNLCALSDTLVLVPELVGRKLAAEMPVKWLPAPAEFDMQFVCFIHFHRSMSGNETMKNIIELFKHAFDV